MESSTDRSEHELGDGDEDTPNTLVTNTEDLLAILSVLLIVWLHQRKRLACYYDVVNVVRSSPLREVAMNQVLLVDVEIAPFRPSEEPRVILDRIALSRSVYHTEHFLQMLLEQLSLISDVQMHSGLQGSPCNIAPHFDLSKRSRMCSLPGHLVSTGTADTRVWSVG